MSPWQAALIPLAIVAVLGSIAFFIGYRGLFSDSADAPSGGPAPTRSPMRSPDAVAAGRDELRAEIAVSDRLIVRAAQERAILVHFIDVSAPGAAHTEEFLAALRRDFSERITFATRHFPASDDGRKGATALEAADRQGQLIPYLEALTLDIGQGIEEEIKGGNEGSGSNRSRELPEGQAHSWNEPGRYEELAGRLGLDTEQFARDMNDASTTAAIEADQANASRVGLTRAPALVLLDDRDDNTLTSLADFRRAVEHAASR